MGSRAILDEAIWSYPMYMSHHRPLYFYEDVYASEYKVKLEKRILWLFNAT